MNPNSDGVAKTKTVDNSPKIYDFTKTIFKTSIPQNPKKIISNGVAQTFKSKSMWITIQKA